MDTPDRPESPPDHPSYPPPAPLSPTPRAPVPSMGPPPAWEPPMASADVEAPARAFHPKLIWQAFRRHWWQVLLLWTAATATLMTLIYYKVRPTYEAIAYLQVEPSSRSLTASASNQSHDFEPFIRTQSLLVTSPDVLTTALADPKVQATALISTSLDPEADLRDALAVKIQEDSHLFTVSMHSESQRDGATIINAVANAYKKAALAWSSEEMKNQIEQLRGLEKQYSQRLTTHQNKLQELYKSEGGTEAAKQLRDDIIAQKGGAPVSYEQLREFAESHMKAEMALMNDTSQLQYVEAELQNRQARLRQAATARSPEELKLAIREAFLQVPVVAQLVADLEEMETQLERVKRPSRNYQNDPAYRNVAREVDRLNSQYEDYWRALYPRIRERVTEISDADREILQALEDEQRQLKLRVVSDKAQEETLRRRLEEMSFEQRNVNDLAFQIEMARTAMDSTQELLDVVQRNINQLEYEQGGMALISIRAPARETGQKATNNRLRMLAAAPVLTFVLVMGLFTLVELRAARVADPDDLPTRVRLGVLGVVPPLPAPSSGRGLRRRDDRRRVEEFVQSLDHLRVALYASRPDGTRHRCVLITSAVGGEGKTTLAAQLAGRCANAGLLTVLVDGDLRRPSLGELLEVPEGPGLAEVLAGEVDPEAAMVVIGNAGGFHLLPAGAPGRDPSRLLHGERLGELIAQLRATFDVVIVDAPPVLAVPDALLLGRWTDGAVLAVRHDSSRFPLVERANRRLAAVGVPVLGAVVNGCRTMETNYGAYQYNAYAGRGAEGGTA